MIAAVWAASLRVALSYLPLVVAVLGLSGCERKVELELAPDVRKASEIAAVLGTHGIEVERKAEKSGVMLSVAHADFFRAMRALREAGLLRPDRPSIDEKLGKRGVAPSPAEERARRVHAIERGLEETLMDIDGVIAARVRIVPSERPAPGAPLASASAAVLVKHRADVDLSSLVPGIASLVKNGTPGLAGADDHRVAVLLVPEQPIANAPAVAADRAIDRSASRLVALACGSMAFGYFADRLLRRVRWRASKRKREIRRK
ncbi:hypothetical protein [Trinickia acidisoli]|uniref:hypothetical protein n=1 Tax=Trinickia acidisoli TaxID=2767482 RepID=UPI001A903472|nr:hypothetical protein [Trinickia acidisoli]